MQEDFTTRAAAIFVCYSELDLSSVCRHLQLQYHLPNFRFDEHSRWQYARSIGQCMGLNVTKTERLGQIAQWMPDIPPTVNYQIILYLKPIDATGGDATHETGNTAHYVNTFLNQLFATEVVWVHQRQL
jgi:hypothetical protein